MGKVDKAIAAHNQQFIHFPTPNETPLAKFKFSQLGGLPRVIGTIDCTHIKICCPGGPNSELYRNRKWYFPMNVQAVCSHDLKEHLAIRRTFSLVDMITNTKISNCPNVFEIGVVWQ